MQIWECTTSFAEFQIKTFLSCFTRLKTDVMLRVYLLGHPKHLGISCYEAAARVHDVLVC